MKKERLKAAVVAAILACQFSSAQLTRAWAGDQAGVASVYSTESGSRTASGEKLNPEARTAAHRTLPFGSKLRVTNKGNGRSVVVTIKDPGQPFQLHGFDHAFPQVTRVGFWHWPPRKGESMHTDSLIHNPLGIPPIQIGRDPL